MVNDGRAAAAPSATPVFRKDRREATTNLGELALELITFRISHLSADEQKKQRWQMHFQHNAVVFTGANFYITNLVK